MKNFFLTIGNKTAQLMTQRSLTIACIGIVLCASILVSKSKGVEAVAPREFEKINQGTLSVRVSCGDIGPRADISWTPVASESAYTVARKAEEDTRWLTIGENVTNLSFVDTVFPVIPDVYQYRVTANAALRRETELPIVAVNIPSCGGADALPAILPLTQQDEVATLAVEEVNLVRNPSFEIADTNGNPRYWQHGGWGTNNGKYIYPSPGNDGGKAAKVEMTSRTSGDIKWFFDDVVVQAGQTYTISHIYKSNEPTELTARFTGPGGIQYQYIKILPEAADWTSSTITIVIPQNITLMTLFHILYSPGSLEIDSFSMTAGSTPTNPTPSPAPTPTPLPPPPPNLIKNPSLETAGTGSNPANWYRGGWGTNTRSYTYPVAGAEGSNKGAKVEIISYVNGDAKWYFENVPVVGGKEYALSHLYKASTQTEILARFTTEGGIEYHHLSTVPATATWNTVHTAVTAPANALSMTLFHLLSSAGVLETDTFTMTEKTSSSLEPAPAETASKYILLNAINWNSNALNTLPVSDASEITYFVLPVSATGVLLSTSPTVENTFVKNVHAGGKKATFSVAGGAQNVADITSAVTAYGAAFIDNIVAHITLHNYDGVTIDIENTSIPAQTMTNFIRTLRTKMNAVRSNLILGIYTQPYQLSTVWANISETVGSITWLAPMIYDRGQTFSTADFRTTMQAWESKVGKEKLMAGVAVNYPSQDGGLSAEQFKEVLAIVTAENWRGIGIWENTLYAQPWRDARRIAWPTIQ